MWKYVGAALVGLEVIYAAIPQSHWFLPLGESHVSQMGIVLGIGFVLHEVTR